MLHRYIPVLIMGSMCDIQVVATTRVVPKGGPGGQRVRVLSFKGQYHVDHDRSVGVASFSKDAGTQRCHTKEGEH